MVKSKAGDEILTDCFLFFFGNMIRITIIDSINAEVVKKFISPSKSVFH